MDIREQKNTLREHVSKLRDNIGADEKLNLDESIKNKFLKTITYKHSKSIIFYSAIKSEIDTTPMIQEALHDGKIVGLPLCDIKTNTISIYEIEQMTELSEGAYGILEPDVLKCKKSELQFDVCIVPALCYDKEGYRLGYGKGYYDRFLESFTGVRIGLCYSMLWQNTLPRGRYDKKVDMIITEKEIFNVRQG